MTMFLRSPLHAWLAGSAVILAIASALFIVPAPDDASASCYGQRWYTDYVLVYGSVQHNIDAIPDPDCTWTNRKVRYNYYERALQGNIDEIYTNLGRAWVCGVIWFNKSPIAV